MLIRFSAIQSSKPTDWHNAQCASRALSALAQSEEALLPLGLECLRAANAFLAHQTPVELLRAISALERAALDHDTVVACAIESAARL